MSGTEFVGIVPGVIDDHARAAKLSGGATGLYRLVLEHADRHTGELSPITVAELSDLSRYGRKAVRRYLDELEAAGLAQVELRQGHDGWLRLTRHGEVIYKANRSRRSTRANRDDTTARVDRPIGSRRSTHRSRQLTQGSRQSTRANRENDPQREEDRRSSISSTAPSGGAPGGPPSGGGHAAADTRAVRALVERLTARLSDFEETRGINPDDGLTLAFEDQLGDTYWDSDGTPHAHIPPEGLTQLRALCAEVDIWLQVDGTPYDPEFLSRRLLALQTEGKAHRADGTAFPAPTPRPVTLGAITSNREGVPT